jgi:hypothetical protein
LHNHLLPNKNSLPKNHYAVKTLTKKLGLAYRSIHVCEIRCVLFQREYANETNCPKCGRPRFKDQDKKKFPIKVLDTSQVLPQCVWCPNNPPRPIWDILHMAPILLCFIAKAAKPAVNATLKIVFSVTWYIVSPR